ncbi:DSBA oxidoreductase [Actibacterium mucosum KCTC 23349]|uniref:DSBA oxidoreductase n=1 Tax=Actibacterium mucosum KCTC 23349 TaxID=1454373 RepID=A0A037ZDC0_9RHOB|nr:DsbA family protein [Actibacterium mucosum]KAJ54459.1 DSBA oxidoreductase [Actibacterium mucosum KCTC 23349]
MRRILALTMALALVSPAQATDLTNMTDAERAAFGAQVRAYLLENPQVLREAIAVLEQREAEEQANADLNLVAAYSDALFNDTNSWQGGNPDGDITLVEFVDYRCSYCRRAHDEVAELISTDGNIKLIVKEFPILGEESVLSSRFAIATRQVAGDAAYKQVHDALITFRGSVSENALRRLAEQFNLDATEILARMNGQEVTEVIQANYALAQAMSINGTPTFVLNDSMLRGYVPLDGMRELVADARG